MLSKAGGFRWTLRILALVVAVLGSLSLLFLKPRLPVALRSSDSNVVVGLRPDFSFLKSPVFIAMVNGPHSAPFLSKWDDELY